MLRAFAGSPAASVLSASASEASLLSICFRALARAVSAGSADSRVARAVAKSPFAICAVASLARIFELLASNAKDSSQAVMHSSALRSMRHAAATLPSNGTLSAAASAGNTSRARRYSASASRYAPSLYLVVPASLYLAACSSGVPGSTGAACGCGRGCGALDLLSASSNCSTSCRTPIWAAVFKVAWRSSKSCSLASARAFWKNAFLVAAAAGSVSREMASVASARAPAQSLREARQTARLEK
mmetsp:Transcript_4818/g.8580  ORF Transcript_4818/g.8580 Transcript_4818/m.8580 type:complete len:244 (+) Transcript_4818:1028-1759(+)